MGTQLSLSNHTVVGGGRGWAASHQVESSQAETACSLTFPVPSRGSPLLGGFRVWGWGEGSPPPLNSLSGHSSYELGHCAFTIDRVVTGVAGMTVELFRGDFHPSVEVPHLRLGSE